MDRLSVAAIAAEVRAGRRSAQDVARDSLARIAAFDAVQPQAWIDRPRAEDVLAAARAVDARIAAGEDLPLAGVVRQVYAQERQAIAPGAPMIALEPA